MNKSLFQCYAVFIIVCCLAKCQTTNGEQIDTNEAMPRPCNNESSSINKNNVEILLDINWIMATLTGVIQYAPFECQTLVNQFVSAFPPQVRANVGISIPQASSYDDLLYKCSTQINITSKFSSPELEAQALGLDCLSKIVSCTDGCIYRISDDFLSRMAVTSKPSQNAPNYSNAHVFGRVSIKKFQPWPMKSFETSQGSSSTDDNNSSSSLSLQNTHLDCAKLCDAIKRHTLSSTDAKQERDARDSWQQVVHLFHSVETILEPRHWLALVVVSWLAACLVIAIYIKRRDRRHLSLYLAERADYKFSTRRLDSHERSNRS